MELLRDYPGVCRRVERALSQADMKAGAVNVKYSCPLEADGEAAEQRRHEAAAMMDFMAKARWICRPASADWQTLDTTAR